MSYPQGPLQGHVYYEEPLQGGVVYNENPFMRILRGVGGVLKDVGGRVAEHAPEILRGVATGLAMSQLGRSGGSQVDYTNNLDYGTRQSSYSPMTMPTVQPIPMREIPQYKPSTLGRDALRQVESRRQAYEPPRYTPPGNPLSSLVNQSNVTPIHQPRQPIQQSPSTDWRSQQSQSSGMLSRALDPSFGQGISNPAQENPAWIQANLSHARRPVTQVEINAIRQQQALQMQRQQALDAQTLTANEQARFYQEQTNAIRRAEWEDRQRQQQNPILARVSQTHYQGIKLPKAVYRDKVTRQEIDLWKEVAQGNDLSDPQLDQLIHSIDIMQYSAQTPYELMDAEVIDNMARERVIENKLAQLEEVEPGYWEYNGMLLEAEEAVLAVELDVEHYWKKNTHLTPEQISEKLKDIAVGTWNFLYGDDINTLLNPDAHPVAKIWAASQFIPVMKVTKAGKAVKLVKFKTSIPLSKMFPLKETRAGFWAPGRKNVNNPIRSALKHYLKHQKDFPEIQNAKQYVEAAWRFMDKPPKGTHVKILYNGERLFYHPPSNTLLVTRNKVPVSFYKPENISELMKKPINKGVYGGFFR